MMLASVYLGLARPEFPSVPEGFITALASEAYKKPNYGVDDQGLRLAVAYESRGSGKSSKTMLYHDTMPSGPGLAAFGDALADAGLEASDDQEALAQAVATGIVGVGGIHGKSRAAIPMTGSLALAQNLRGLVRKPQPADLAGILERFYAMGAPVDSAGQPSAAMCWKDAAEHRRNVDRLVRVIDLAVESTVFAAPNEARASNPIGVCTDDFQGTPFEWFYRIWTKLCRPEWVEALPARVWVDWANTVLRLSFGFGYLWEIAWYESVTRSVLGGANESSDGIKRQVGELLPWRDASAAVSLRDIAASTKWRAARSNRIRDAIKEWVNDHPDNSDATDQLVTMRQDEDFKQSLTAAMADASSSNDNLWEAIRYSLQRREGVGHEADHYGFIRKNGPRYSVPDPGVEWIAALASLTCPSPGGSSNVGNLLKDLRMLGLRPELGDLVRRLEQAGIARGSADADQAVEIQSAF